MVNIQLKSLINSLSKSEKRYFKINASVNKTNKTLLRMFDLIDKNEITNEKTILKALKVNHKKNLAVIETRLNALILKHLRNFHSSTSNEIELHNLLIEIEILINKRLFKNASKLILKAKKMAYTLDNHLALLSILKWESYLEKEEGKYLKKSQEKLLSILKEEKLILSSYSRLVEYKRHSFNFLLLSKNKIVAQLNEEIKAYDSLVKEGFFAIKPNYSFEEKIYLLNFKGMYYMSKSDFPKCLEQYEKLIFMIENSKKKNIFRSQEYFLGLNNLLLLNVMNKKFDNYNDTLSKIYNTFGDYPEYKALLFNVTQCYELGIYCEIGEKEKGISLIPGIEENLKLFDSETNDINKLLFYLNIAIIYFFNKNYSKSIYWLNTFLNDYSIKRNDVTSNIYYYANIINILVHFEAKNYETIEYLYKQCNNTLKKIRKINQFDKAILSFLRNQASNTLTKQGNSIKLFTELKNELGQLMKSPEENIALQFFDFIAWTDSHIYKKEIADIIKEKNLN